MTEQPQRMSFGSAAAVSIVLALGIGFATIHVIPLATRLGVPGDVADKLPFLGFFGGGSWGIAAGFSKVARNTLANAFAVIAFGAVMWFFGVVLEGVLVAANLDEDSVGWVSSVAFWLGIAAGRAGLFFGALEDVEKLFSRGGASERKREGRSRRG